MRETADHTRPVGPTTLRRIHATLPAALNAAVKQRRLIDNPALHVELPSAPQPKPVVWTTQRVIEWMATGRRPKVAVWAPSQIGDFLDVIADDRLYAYYHLLMFRGPRRGEGIGLLWSDLDLDAETANIARQTVQIGWETETTPPKADSDGVIALDSVTVAMLRTHRRQQLAEKRDWGAAWTDTHHVFTIETGLPVRPEYVGQHFVRVVRRANTLRHA